MKFCDISNNKYQDEIDNFNDINKIMKEFESFLLSIEKDFESLNNDFKNNIGNMKDNLTKKFEKIYRNNFNIYPEERYRK